LPIATQQQGKGSKTPFIRLFDRKLPWIPVGK
jgi:hypothetical protein